MHETLLIPFANFLNMTDVAIKDEQTAEIHFVLLLLRKALQSNSVQMKLHDCVCVWLP